MILANQRDCDQWLDLTQDAAALALLFEPYPAEKMHLYRVSNYVNKPGNEGPRCLEPAA